MSNDEKPKKLEGRVTIISDPKTQELSIEHNLVSWEAVHGAIVMVLRPTWEKMMAEKAKKVAEASLDDMEKLRRGEGPWKKS